MGELSKKGLEAEGSCANNDADPHLPNTGLGTKQKTRVLVLDVPLSCGELMSILEHANGATLQGNMSHLALHHEWARGNHFMGVTLLT